MWKPVPNFEGLYEVSNKGKIRSLDREVVSSTGQRYTIKGKVLKPPTAGKGYLSVMLWKKGKPKRVYLHIIVATVYVKNPHNLPIVNHKNGDKTKCEASNLEWTTYSGNNQHAYDTGLHGKGEKHYKAKLTLKDVRKIRKEGKYTTYQKIADKYGVSKATIRDILENRTWVETD